MNTRGGQMAVTVLFFSALAVIIISGLAFLGATGLQLSVRHLNRSQAFAIAEAGLEYYRWHLSHAPQDFWDGQGETSTGPYVHPYYNQNGVRIGEFALQITPPPASSTLVVVRSTGRVDADPSIQKIIEVKMLIPSFTRYSLVLDDDLRIGPGTEVYGELFSNGGIRFDGRAHNVVKSARSAYNDPDHGGGNEFGVHTHVNPVDPNPPAAVPARPDVFLAGRQFPVPALDFEGVTQDLSEIKAKAETEGVYASSSGVYGFELALTGDTYSLYKVTALASPPNGCTNTSNQPGWGTWSVQTTSLVRSGAIPASGTFFFEDHVWVKGQIDGHRLVIASGKFPDNSSTRTNIIFNQDVRYASYDGSDSIAFIAQGNIYIGLFSNDILRIDGALFAQNGRIARFYYQAPSQQSGADKCGPYALRQKITVFGALISNLMYELGFEDSTGYLLRELIFDSNLFYQPPPSFPAIGEDYVQVSWDEIQ